jgi:hypothetical protein
MKVQQTTGSPQVPRQYEEPQYEEQQYIEALWSLYYERLKDVVRGRVHSIKRPVANESEIALSAFHSLVQYLRAKDQPELPNQNEIWYLLKRIAFRKASRTKKHLLAKRRGGECVTFPGAGLDNQLTSHNGSSSNNKTAIPVAAEIEAEDWFNALIKKLPDEKHRNLIYLKLEGYTFCEIAEILQMSTRTARRIAAKIQANWQQEAMR